MLHLLCMIYLLNLLGEQLRKILLFDTAENQGNQEPFIKMFQGRMVCRLGFNPQHINQDCESCFIPPQSVEMLRNNFYLLVFPLILEVIPLLIFIFLTGFISY